MTYKEAIDYLYSQAPMFQHIGKKAYKTGLETTYALDAHYGHPHRAYRTVHIAGTNGKGSTSHMMAAILQSAGYKTGLYTSPHLKDFRERIRINGQMIPQEYVCAFVEGAKETISRLNPSFFEITTAMAFRYFADERVDVAVIEVGLGGRLDCTNVITPEVSVITNISIDHTDLLGDTLEAIAHEKAGIIKPGVPVIIGETQPESAPVFIAKAREAGAPIHFADKEMSDVQLPPCEMEGIYQEKNRRTVLAAVRALQDKGWKISAENIREGLANVCSLTGIMGRWQKLGEHPAIVCDTGHNEAGIRFVTEQLRRQKYNRLHIVIGVVSDKKIDKILPLLPKEAIYYFTKAQIPRALDEHSLMAQAAEYGLRGNSYPTVAQAFNAAKENAEPDDFIFIGGSNFTVAEIL